MGQAIDAYPMISIHTLAWRVTIDYRLIKNWFEISIHTLAWRVTNGSVIIRFTHEDFNPHPRVEGDGWSA